MPPGDDDSKPTVRLAPDTRSDVALAEIGRALLGVIDANLGGVRGDLDSELLHDFRVGVRRTRWVLKDARGVWPSDPLDRWRSDFRWLQQVTGPARDLDVFVLQLPAVQASLPGDRAADLDELADLLAVRRRRAQRALVRSLDTKRARHLLEDWPAFLDQMPLDDPTAPDASRPIGAVAGSHLWRAYRRVTRRGRSIDDSSPPDELHDLRKRAKELRYGLERYESLYGRKSVKRLVKVLKRLQDNLGELQDCQVQAAELGDLAHEIGAGPSAPGRSSTPATRPGVLIALGVLIERCSARERAARAEFAGHWADFDGRANRRRFASLLRPQDP